MSNLKGTNISAPITTFTDTDKYPTHYSKYGKGGKREVADITERDNIPKERREIGMDVTIISTGVDYRLVGGIENSNWILKDDINLIAFKYVREESTLDLQALITFSVIKDSYITFHNKNENPITITISNSLIPIIVIDLEKNEVQQYQLGVLQNIIITSTDVCEIIYEGYGV